MNANILLSLVEFAIAGYSVWMLRGAISSASRLDLGLLVVGLVVCGVAVSRSSGLFALATGVKIASFLLVTRLAMARPLLATRLVVMLSVVNLLVHAADGDILTKYSAWPFLLWAGCFLFGKRLTRPIILKIFLGALLLEVLQSWFVDGRGLLITSMLVIAASLLPPRWYRWFWILFARLAPVIYPIVLLLALLSFARGDEYVQPTASNIERSALAFWCITLMPDYVASGPGPDYFFENVNAALATAGRAREDDGIDPHSFLLSYWVGLGVLSMTVTYLLWWRMWSRFASSGVLAKYHDRITGSIFAASAAMMFTLSAPDSYTRVLCGLCTGLAVRAYALDASTKK